MAKSTAYGIVLTENFAQRLAVTAEFRKGDGYLTAEGNVTGAIRHVLYAVMEAVSYLESYMDGISVDKFSTHDLKITFSEVTVPFDGESYGLPLAMAIVGAMMKEQISDKTCFTGAIDPGGVVIPVEDIDKKRQLAAALGFRKIVLPSRQLDILCAYINQCPVDSIYGAVTGYFWD